MIRRYFDIKELDATMLNKLVSKIVVHEREIVGNERIQKIDIYYNFVGVIGQAREHKTVDYHSVGAKREWARVG